MKSISATSVSTFYKCPLQWKYKYLLRLLQQKSKALYIGSLYHECLEAYHNGSDVNNILESADIPAEEIELVATMFNKYKESPVMGDIIQPEYRFDVKIEGVDVPIIGYIDRLDKDKVVEYKTSSFDYKDEHTHTIQSRLYAYVARKYFGYIVPVVYSVVNKKRAHVKKYKPQTLSIVYTDEELDKLEAELKLFPLEIHNSNFPPCPGVHCYWCPWGIKGGDGVCTYSK